MDLGAGALDHVIGQFRRSEVEPGIKGRVGVEVGKGSSAHASRSADVTVRASAAIAGAQGLGRVKESGLDRPERQVEVARELGLAPAGVVMEDEDRPLLSRQGGGTLGRADPCRRP